MMVAQHSAVGRCRVPPPAEDHVAWRHYIAACADEHGLAIFYTDQGRYRDHCHWHDGQRQHVEIDPVALLRRAIMVQAAGLILYHNHPSGDCRPSPADIRTTRRLVNGCASLGIACIDHVILAGARQFSMRDAGLL